LVSTFNDGEPIDPKKLEDLQTQITNLQNESAVQKVTTGDLSSSLRSITYHSQSGVVEVDPIIKGKTSSPEPIPVKWSTDYDKSTIRTVVTLRSKTPKLDIRYSISGNSNYPTLLVYANENTSILTFDWISVAGKIFKT